jgi:hypothetical protein
LRHDSLIGNAEPHLIWRREGATMKRYKFLFWVLRSGGATLFVCAGRHAQNALRPSADAAPALEPKAIEILKAASNRLAAAHSMTFTADVTYESPTRQGPPLVYATQSDVTLVRPNKLRVISPGDGPASEFYYDGKVMMAYAPVGISSQ